MVREIAFEEWKQLAEQTQVSTASEIWPWQNLFQASQYTGIDFVSGPDPKYFGFFIQGELVAALCVLKISETVGRIRIPCCKPSYRKKGVTTELLQAVLELHRSVLQKWVVFADSKAVSFYRRSGFELEPGFAPLPVWTYDPQAGTSKKEDSSLRVMVRREKQPSRNPAL